MFQDDELESTICNNMIEDDGALVDRKSEFKVEDTGKVCLFFD